MFSKPSDLIDLVDRLSDATPDRVWPVALEFASKIGISAINVLDLNAASHRPMSFHSSMNADWLSSYTEQEFFKVDPMLPQLIGGKGEKRVTAGVLARSRAGSTDLAWELNHQLYEAGYTSMIGEDFYVGGTSDTRRLTVAFSTNPPPIASAKIFMAVLASYLPQTAQAEHLAEIIFGPGDVLSPRERDVLTFLALGLRNDAISYRLGIAEITVRKHVKSARMKLGASTREQAIALAIRSGLLNI